MAHRERELSTEQAFDRALQLTRENLDAGDLESAEGNLYRAKVLLEMLHENLTIAEKHGWEPDEVPTPYMQQQIRHLAKQLQLRGGNTRFILNPSNEPPPDFGRALEGYQAFQKLEPTEIGTFVGLRIPRMICSIGDGVNVLYRSDKWENKYHNYIHDHDPGVHYYRPPTGDGDGPLVRVPTFILAAETLYKLGECIGFKTDETEMKTSKPRPDLYSIPSGKALVIVDSTGPRAELVALAWGGSLDVKDVGIVG